MKMLFIGLAGGNVMVFYAMGLNRRVDAIGAGQDAPALAKVVAAVSLASWLGVVFWGRMMPFLGTSF